MIDSYRLPAYVTGLGAEGSSIYSTRPVREYRDSIGIDERITYSRGCSSRTAACSSRPGRSRRTWTLSVRHSDEDAQCFLDNVEAFAKAVTLRLLDWREIGSKRTARFAPLAPRSP